MVHPHLAGAERATGGEMLLGDEELAIGRPARLVEEAEIFLRDLALIAAVAVHQPDIVAARAVGDERDAPAVAREARLMLKGETLSDARRRPALDRHDVDVAQQVERERAATRSDGRVHPASLTAPPLD